MEAKPQHGGTGCSVLSLTVVPAHCSQKMEIVSQRYIFLFKMVRVGRWFLCLSFVMPVFSCAVAVPHCYNMLCVFGGFEENNKNHLRIENLWSSA